MLTLLVLLLGVSAANAKQATPGTADKIAESDNRQPGEVRGELTTDERGHGFADLGAGAIKQQYSCTLRYAFVDDREQVGRPHLYSVVGGKLVVQGYGRNAVIKYRCVPVRGL